MNQHLSDRCHLLAQKLQVLAGAAHYKSFRVFVEELQSLSESLPEPANFAEECVQGTLLREFIGKTTTYFGDAGPSVFQQGGAHCRPTEFRAWVASLTSHRFLAPFRHFPAGEVGRRVMEILLEEYDQSLTLERVAKRIGRNPSYVSTVLHQRLGLTFRTCLSRVRIARAVQLLRAGTKPDAVAFLVGYRSKSEFYKVFERLVGLTPGEFRRRALAANQS